MRTLSTLDQWIEQDAMPFAIGSPASGDRAVDRVMASLGDSIELLGLGEALHGSEEILALRNRMFQRLVEAHGISAVVLEVSSPQARAINDYVLGRRDGNDNEVAAWFATGFGLLDANRELIEWIRGYNADPEHRLKLHFYGFDLPLGQGGLASPGRVLDIALSYLDSVDRAAAGAHRQRMRPLIGDASEWERPAAMFDPAQSIGLTPRASELRIATLDLISELRTRRPEFAAPGEPLEYLDGLHHAELARKLLDAHAALATPGAYARMLGVRDLIMADNLESILGREHGRGKVFVYSAGGHLKRGMVEWHLPPEPGVKRWWPAGAQLTQTLGRRYAVIGMAVGVSEDNRIGEPEAQTLESRLAKRGSSLFIPTHRGEVAPPAELAHVPVRSGSALNPTYAPLTPESFSDYEWLVFFESTVYPRGSPPLTDWSAE